MDEVAKEMQNIAHDTEQQGYHQHQNDLWHEGPNHEDMWYEAFNHDNFPYDDASPLATEVSVVPRPLIEDAARSSVRYDNLIEWRSRR
jgi:arylsulfatase A-like enzyme